MPIMESTFHNNHHQNDPDTDFYKKVRKNQILDVDFSSLEPKHAFDDREKMPNASCDSKSYKTILNHIMDLETSLPDCCPQNPLVLIQYDSSFLGLVRVLLSGPEDTPYQNGLFVFDILLPEGYPNKVPKVRFLTTGGGKACLNPNLYANGYVCLSLINTWGGNVHERWDPKSSNLCQIIISLQALVLNSHPYLNEPGFSYQDPKSSQSIKYNCKIRRLTVMHAMLEYFEIRRRSKRLNSNTSPCLVKRFSGEIWTSIIDWWFRNFKFEEISGPQKSEWTQDDETIKEQFRLLDMLATADD